MGNDIRKAAVLLMSLPEAQAAQLLSQLEPKLVEAVSIEIARAGAVSPDEQQTTILDFANSAPGGLSSQSGGLDIARKLVEQALGKASAPTIETIRQSIEGLPFGFLQKIDTQNLLTFISDEHPQTIALILSHLKPPQAAEIIAWLNQD